MILKITACVVMGAIIMVTNHNATAFGSDPFSCASKMEETKRLIVQRSYSTFESLTRNECGGRIPDALPFISKEALSKQGFVERDIRQRCQNSNSNSTLSNTVLKQLNVQRVPVPKSICQDEEVGITYLYWSPPSSDTGRRRNVSGVVESHEKNEKTTASPPPPLVVLLHGFDLSCLEFRTLGPLLATFGYHVVAPDLLGWGFTQVDRVTDFTSNAKTHVLATFLQDFSYGLFCADETGTTASKRTVNICLIGASLGAAMSLELFSYLNHINYEKQNCSREDTKSSFNTKGGSNLTLNVKSAVWISAQVFWDATILKYIPNWYARWLIKLLKVPFLRRIVNSMSVHDQERYYSKEGGEGEDVLKLWNLCSQRPGWEEAHYSFMKGGGFAPTIQLKTHAKQLNAIPSLIIGGKNDGILGNYHTNRLSRFLKNQSQLLWIPDCGHFPHEEKPNETAEAIGTFLQTWMPSTP